MTIQLNNIGMVIRLLLLLMVFAVTMPSRASLVVFAFTNSATGQLDTNAYRITPRSNIQNADGTWDTVGPVVQYQNPTGYATNFLVPNNYLVTNPATGFWESIRVPDASSNIVWAGAISLGQNANPFVTLIVNTNMGGGGSGSIVTTNGNYNLAATNPAGAVAFNVDVPNLLGSQGVVTNNNTTPVQLNYITLNNLITDATGASFGNNSLYANVIDVRQGGQFYGNLAGGTNLPAAGISTNGSSSGQVLTSYGGLTAWRNAAAGGSGNVSSNQSVAFTAQVTATNTANVFTGTFNGNIATTNSLLVPPYLPPFQAVYSARSLMYTNDGAYVGTWPDSSGNGNNLVCTNFTFAKSVINGYPGVWMGTLGALAYCTNFFSTYYANSNFTITVVFQTNPKIGNNAMVMSSGTVAGFNQFYLNLDDQVGVGADIAGTNFPAYPGASYIFNQSVNIWTVRYDGTNCDNWMNGIPAFINSIGANGNPAGGHAGGAGMNGNLYLGNLPDYHFGNLNAYVGEFWFSTNVFSYAQIDALNSALINQYQKPQNQVILTGDSITYGAYATNGSYLKDLVANQFPTWEVSVEANVANNSAQVLTNQSYWVQLHRNSTRIAVFMERVNDDEQGISVAQSLTNALLFVTACHSNQTAAVICTIPSYGYGDTNTTRTNYNYFVTNSIYKSFDALCDYAANPTMGAQGASVNTTYFHNDYTHPNAAGYQILGPILGTAIQQANNAWNGQTNGNAYIGSFTGNGAGLTNIPGASVNLNNITVPTAWGTNAFSAVGSATYLQGNIQNTLNTGSSDWVATEDTGGPTNNYVDLFQNNSAYSASANGTLDSSNDAGIDFVNTNSGATYWIKSVATNGLIRMVTAAGGTAGITNITLYPAVAAANVSNVLSGTTFGTFNGTHLGNAITNVAGTNAGAQFSQISQTAWINTNALPNSGGATYISTNAGTGWALTVNTNTSGTNALQVNGTTLLTTNPASANLAVYVNGNLNISGTLPATALAGLVPAGSLSTNAFINNTNLVSMLSWGQPLPGSSSAFTYTSPFAGDSQFYFLYFPYNTGYTYNLSLANPYWNPYQLSSSNNALTNIIIPLTFMVSNNATVIAIQTRPYFQTNLLTAAAGTTPFYYPGAVTVAYPGTYVSNVWNTVYITNQIPLGILTNGVGPYKMFLYSAASGTNLWLNQ